MEAKDQVKKFREFFEQHELDRLMQQVRSGKFWIEVDFLKLSMFEPELADSLIEDPEEVVKAAELAFAEFDFEDSKKCKVRFYNLVASQKMFIRNIRSTNIGKLYSIEGIVRQKSDVRPQVTSAKFECPTCGNIINVLQLDQSFREPSRCSCGRKGKFNLTTKELVDAQRLVLEEAPETLVGGEQPKRMSVFLKDDLVSPLSERKTNPGSKINVIGYVKETPIIQRSGVRSTTFDLYIEANNVIPIEETFIEVDVNPEEEKEIIELSQDRNVMDKLSQSVAPSIFGYEKIKQALVLQMLGGVQKTRSDGVVSRGDMHVLLIGDPGAAKSAILKAVSRISPKARYISGKGISAAGLTASVVKDEFLRGWSLEAGAMVLASDGLCCLHPKTDIVADDKISSIESLFSEEKKKIGKIGGEAVEYHPVDFSVHSIHDTKIVPKKATLIRRKKYSGKLLKVAFRSGNRISLTKDHLLLDESFKWREAAEFNPGQTVIAPLKLDSNNRELGFVDLLPDSWKVKILKEEKEKIKKCVLGKFPTLSEFNRKFCLSKGVLSGASNLSIADFKKISTEVELPKIHSFYRNHLGVPAKIDKVTPELSYLLGFCFGDGHVKKSKRRHCFAITQSIKNREQIETIRRCWNSVFFKPMREYTSSRSGKIRGRGFSSTTTSFRGNNLIAAIYESLVAGGLSGILRLNQECLRAFMAGVMDADGNICTKTKNGRYKTQHIVFVISKDRRTNRNFILSLRRFDCYARLVEQENKNVDIIQITGRKDVENLVNDIRQYSVKCRNLQVERKIFNIGSESDKMPREIVAKFCADVSNMFKKTELLKMGIWSTIYRYKNQTIWPKRDQVEKIMRLLDAEDSMVEKLLCRDHFLDEIESVEEAPYDGWVYDLFVPETNNFVANGIIVHNCIDEMDKMGVEDTAAMHEALENQTVSISKANIQATLIARTTVLAAANPQYGRFDPYKMIADQINLPPTLINRFDLIFPIKDLPDKDRDDKLSSHILGLHQNPEMLKPIIDPNLLKKYIAYSKQKIKPELTDEALEEIKAYYLKMRASGSDEGALPVIPISARQLEALVRLSEASARARLSLKVEVQDSQRAIDLIHFSLRQVGLDPETGKIDIDRIATGISASQRNNIFVIKEIITELEGKVGKTIPIDDITHEARVKGISGEKVDEVIEKLKRSGDVFEPRKGFIQKI
ncbi:hypothetical protein HY638_02470 [Candidatus Woesearchaeota archaeon]|nr:hypothetical protein [Candidatus Woesearchaeota archaeon]